MKRPIVHALVLALACVSAAPAAEVLRAPPAKPDPARRYLFYLHGAIVEQGGEKPVHPRWGLYDYPAVLEALGARGAALISERRGETEPVEYAERVAEQVRSLLRAGVPAGRIGIVGFSKGGAIAIHASHLLARADVAFVLLGACGEWLADEPGLRLHGRVLSIRETSDTVGGSCRSLADRRGGSGAFEEIAISTGKEHGAFYLPRAVWVEPTLDHLAQENR